VTLALLGPRFKEAALSSHQSIRSLHLSAAPQPPRVRSSDNFYDKTGKPMSLTEWVIRRRDPEYCRLGYWEGEGGAWIYTFWLGLDMSFGVGAMPAIFDTHVAAFGNQPHVEWTCPTDTSQRALALHHRVVDYVERGLIPPMWNLDDI
jgi:hypothetical protein